MLKTLWKHRARLSYITFKDYLRCRKDLRLHGVSDVPLLYLQEQDIRDPEHMFRDQAPLDDLLF